MKNLILTISLCLIVSVVFSQTNKSSNRQVHSITAPDGSVAITIYDNLKKNNIELQSVDAFYKFEILDEITSEPIYTAKNKGRACNIDKSLVGNGTYKLRMYTSNFVITSKIIVTASRKFNAAIKSGKIAIND